MHEWLLFAYRRAFCLPKALSIYLIFQSKLLKQIKKFSNECHSHTLTATKNGGSKKQEGEEEEKTMKMLKLLETHFKSMFYNKSTSTYNNNDLPKRQTALPVAHITAELEIGSLPVRTQCGSFQLVCYASE